jgi:hypothetical protein
MKKLIYTIKLGIGLGIGISIGMLIWKIAGMVLYAFCYSVIMLWEKI